MKGRKYLRRLTIAILLGGLIPALVAFAMFSNYTLSNREQFTEEAYERTLDTYVSMLDRKIQELEAYSARISVESRESGSLLKNGFETLDPYRIYLLTQFLKQQYLRTDVSDWGIYSYDSQRIITPQYSCTLQDFLYKYTSENDTDTDLIDLFSEDRYKLNEALFGTTACQGQDGYLIVGVCTRLGYTNDRAMVFYVISPENIKKSLVMVGDEGIAYYLLNKEKTVLLSWGDLPEESADTILQVNAWKTTMGIRQQIKYDIKSQNQELYLTAYVWENPFQDTIIGLIKNTWLIVIGIAVLMLIVSGAAIYVSYKPVHELTERFDYRGGNEFEIILNQMNANVSKIDEQQMLIINLLMNHLLYGVPISKEQIQRLIDVSQYQYYCVCLLDGYSFINSQMSRRLTDELERECSVRGFLTDWYEGNCTVLVCFMEQEDTSVLLQKLKNSLQANCDTVGELYAGPVCDNLENIQQSFRSCIEQRRKTQKSLHSVEKAETPKRIQQKEVLKQIRAYLEDNFRDSGISQVQVADQFHISNYTLSRIFKSEMGIGFAEYLSVKRLEYAKELLLNTSYTVREIALMSGFTHENYFSRTFKVYTGSSPSAFRKQQEK